MKPKANLFGREPHFFLLGKVAKKLMLTQKNKLSDCIGATSGETYTDNMTGIRSDVDVTHAFATPAMVAAVDAETLIKLKKELKDPLDDCKPMHRHKITRRFYYKSSGEHEIHEDVTDADCDFFLESLAEKPGIENSYVLVVLPSPVCTIKYVKSYMDLSNLLECASYLLRTIALIVHHSSHGLAIVSQLIAMHHEVLTSLQWFLHH